MQLTVQVALAIIGTAALLCLGAYVYLAYRGESSLLYSSIDSRLMTFGRRMFFLLAALGLLTCMFQGAEAMLWWLPSSWGSHDEYGDFTSLRVYVAATFTFIAGGALAIFIDRSAHNSFFLRDANLERRELRRVLKGYNATASLELIAKEYVEAQKTLDAKLSAYGELGHSELTYSLPEGQTILIYRQLEAEVAARIAELQQRERADDA